MVKRTSCLVSTEVFRVRVLVGLLEDNDETKGQPDGRRNPVGSRLSFAALRVRLPLLPLKNETHMLTVA